MAKAAGPRYPYSLWDRLTDPDLIGAAERETSQAARVGRLRREVLTHVEWLLNSRCRSAAVEDADELLKGSLAAYGLPDVSAFRVGDPRDRARLERVLAEVIERFEPRLRNVRVRFDPDRASGVTALHYRVTADIVVKPVNQPVEFDTVLDLGGAAKVEGAG